MRRSQLRDSLNDLVKKYCAKSGVYRIFVFDTNKKEQMDKEHLIGWSLCTVKKPSGAEVQDDAGSEQVHLVNGPEEMQYWAKICHLAN